MFTSVSPSIESYSSDVGDFCVFVEQCLFSPEHSKVDKRRWLRHSCPCVISTPRDVATISIRQKELISVLKANHLTSAKGVAQKAQTIMRQVDGSGLKVLTLDDFIVLAKKFPNLVSRVAFSRRNLVGLLLFPRVLSLLNTRWWQD